MRPFNDSNENNKIHTVNSTFRQTGGHKKGYFCSKLDVYFLRLLYFLYSIHNYRNTAKSMQYLTIVTSFVRGRNCMTFFRNWPIADSFLNRWASRPLYHSALWVSLANTLLEDKLEVVTIVRCFTVKFQPIPYEYCLNNLLQYSQSQ